MAYNTSLAGQAFMQFGMGSAEEKKKAATLATAVSNAVNKQNASPQTNITTTTQNKNKKQNSFDDLFLEGFNSARDRDWRAEQAKLEKARAAYADMQKHTPADTLRGMMNGIGIQQSTATDTHSAPTVRNGELTPYGERAFLEGFNQYRENVEQPQVKEQEKPKSNKILDGTSNILTAASLIPGLDTFTNLASIPVDLLRGDYISAGLDLLGVIPFVGEIADVAKTARTADRIIDGVRTADKVVDVVRVADKTLDGLRTADRAVDALEAVDDATDAARVMDDAVDIQKVSDSSGLIQTHKLTKSKKQFAELLDDISNNGIKEPIKYVEHNGEKYVVDGHHRLRAARILGLDEIPIQKVDLPYKGYYTTDDLFWMK